MKALLPIVTALGLTVVNPNPRAREDVCDLKPQVIFYEVEGSSVAEIHASLRERGPRDDRGKARFAYTDWTIEWGWGTTPARHVLIDSLNVTCSATIKLPKLMVRRETPIEVVRAWNDFTERTREHELNHLENVSRGAARIRQRLKDTEARRGKLSPKLANSTVARVVEEIREFDRSYDRRTNHGYTEGTWDITLMNKQEPQAP